jgi:hypothetical protein
MLLLVLLAGLAAPSAANAAIPSVFGGTVPCTVVGEQRQCAGKVDTFDGIPIDVNVAFPPEPATPPDADYPLVMVFHGWGGSKLSFAALERWTDLGYAAFSMSDRGFGQSCGQPPSRLTPDCAQGHIRLMDTRYEVHDAQHLSGLLVDDGLVDPLRLGSTGGSYGGGLSMALAALRNRIMLPNGTLVPWTSPGGTAMELAAAAPEIPWTDMAYSLAPNGRTLDYVADSPYGTPFGVMKQSFVSGLYAAGNAAGFIAAPGTDPDADLTTWFTLVNAGEPYDSNPAATGIAEELTTHHSSYYIDDSIAPAPLLISNGWTDDLFPADEAIRFYNRTRTRHPGSHLALYFLDYGHQRGQNKDADIDGLRAAQEAWFAHFVRGDGPAPPENVTTLTQTCPESEPSLGPFTAPTWAQVAPGEVRFFSAPAKTIAPAAGNPQTSQAFDPIAGGGACARTSGADQPGTATYRLDPAPAGGLTLMGSPTVIADVTSPGPHSQIAARLLDVGPDGQQTLIARALYRAAQSPDARRLVFQLHPNGWRFAEGHVPKLELLPADTPYSRATNGQAQVTVANLELRLPVLEAPGSAGGRVSEPAPKPLPEGYELAIDFRSPTGPGSEPIPQPQAPVRACSDGVRKRGTARDDRLMGSRRGDRIRGKGGADRLIGRGGRDCLGAGPGNDRVNSRDNQRDAVRCGRGRDLAIADRADRLIGCEIKRRSR